MAAIAQSPSTDAQLTHEQNVLLKAESSMPEPLSHQWHVTEGKKEQSTLMWVG